MFIRRARKWASNSAFSPDNGRTWKPLQPQPDFDSKLREGLSPWHVPVFCGPRGGSTDHAGVVARRAGLGSEDRGTPLLVKTSTTCDTAFPRTETRPICLTSGIARPATTPTATPWTTFGWGRTAITWADVGCIPIRTRRQPRCRCWGPRQALAAGRRFSRTSTPACSSAPGRRRTGFVGNCHRKSPVIPSAPAAESLNRRWPSFPTGASCVICAGNNGGNCATATAAGWPTSG